MKRIVSLFIAGIMAVFMGLTSLGTASASPVAIQVPAASNVVQVQHEKRRYEHRNEKKRWERHDRRHDRYENRRDRRGYWNGHRGYREHRRGYRRHSDGYWYPLAIFRL
jgi:hypothetical protein